MVDKARKGRIRARQFFGSTMNCSMAELVKRLIEIGEIKRPSPARKIGRKTARKMLIKYGWGESESNTKAPPRKNPSASDVNAPAFLTSYKWRSLRMEVLTKYGARCMCCGATPADGAKIHVDHIKPRRDYPELALTFSNLQVLCEECNHGKGNWDRTDWRPTQDSPTLN